MLHHRVARLAASLHAGFGLVGSALGQRCPAELSHPASLVMHVRSGDIFTAWRDGNRTSTHAGFNSEMSSRGQPPLSFYLRAIAHAREEHHAEQTQTHHHHHSAGSAHEVATSPPSSDAAVAGGGADAHHPALVLVTSPDKASPVVRAFELLASHQALRTATMRISASGDFQTDLRLLLCARNIALATSTLSELVYDSPHLRNAYIFDRSSCSARNLSMSPCEHAPTARTPWQRWCLRPEEVYTPTGGKWYNNDAQQLEMVLGGNTSWPVPSCEMRQAR